MEEAHEDGDETIQLIRFKKMCLLWEDRFVAWFKAIQYVSNLWFGYLGTGGTYVLCVFLWVFVWGDTSMLYPHELYQILVLAGGAATCFALYARLYLSGYGPIFLISTSLTLFKLGWKTFWKWRRLLRWQRVLALVTLIAVTMSVLHVLMRKLAAEREINTRERAQKKKDGGGEEAEEETLDMQRGLVVESEVGSD